MKSHSKAHDSDRQPVDLASLIADLPRGKSPQDIGQPSTSYFESPDNLAATPSLRFDPRGNPESKVFLGVLGGAVHQGKPLPDGRPNRWVEGGKAVGVGDDRHVLTVAGSRAGKGRSALLANLGLLGPETSVLTLDPKGDLARLTAKWRAEGLGQETCVLDPMNCSGAGTRPYRGGFNAIEILLRSDAHSFVPSAKLIADSLITPGNQREPHWDDSSRNILAGLVCHVATHSAYEGQRDLVTIWQLAGELATPDPSDPRRYWLEVEMLENDAASGMVRAAARQFYDRSGGEFTSVLSNLRKNLDWISMEAMHPVLRGPSINLRDFKRKSVSWYVTIPAMLMEPLKGWMRLLVQMTLSACEAEPSNDRPQGVMILDEFHALGRMSSIESAIAQIAGLGVKLWVVLQDLGQLKHHYEKNYETFLANAGIVQCFGAADETTLSYVSKRLGDALTLTRSTQSPTFEQAAKQAATGESWSVGTHPLLTPEEVGRVFSRDDKKLRQLVLRPGYRPMILQRVFYDRHEFFAPMRIWENA